MTFTFYLRKIKLRGQVN